jgi:hypothetical protein
LLPVNVGQRIEGLEGARVELGTRRGAGIARRRQRHADGQDLCGAEAWINADQVGKTSQREAGTHQQHRRQRDLAGDQ